jgi:hypothetical protein
MVDCADVDARVTEAQAMMASWELAIRCEGCRLLGQMSW